jgi:hypothetical protein
MQPWPSVALVFIIGVVLPAIWSKRGHRQRAAMAVIRAFLEAATVIADAIRGSHCVAAGSPECTSIEQLPAMSTAHENPCAASEF